MLELILEITLKVMGKINVLQAYIPLRFYTIIVASYH